MSIVILDAMEDKNSISDNLKEKIIQRGDELSYFELRDMKIPRIMYRPLVVLMNQRTKKLAKESGNADFARKVYLE